MSEIPRDASIDSSLALLSEGYRFMPDRHRRFGSDIFQARLMGRTFYCVTGAEAAEMFYTPDRFTRRGALPTSVLHLLQDKGSVATLDAAHHRRRKDMLMSLMTPQRLGEIARLAADGLRDRAQDWRDRGAITLHEEFQHVLCRAACRWAGVPADESELADLTHEMGAMVENAGSVGPSNWAARVRRRHSEHLLKQRVEGTRTGAIPAPRDSALQVIASHRDTGGELLPAEIAAVELLNILRPITAIARFMTFAALAVHEHPECRDGLARDDTYLEAFVQEVRRFYPFFPVVAGIAREPFSWRGMSFDEGAHFALDLYGTDHDERLWPEPETFRPDRFLDWAGNPFTLIPQGGGDHYRNHRCPGEWLTIDVMKAMLQVLVRELDYDVPEQDLSIDLSEMPALPRSGFIVEVKGARAAVR